MSTDFEISAHSKPASSTTPTIWLVTVFGSIAAAGFGFDQAWWASTGVGYAGVILGLMCASTINERLGRKKTMWAQSFIVSAGVIIESTVVGSFAQFLVGKAIVYFGGGIATGLIPVYQAEVSPPHLRGVMSGTYNAFLMVGGVCASLIVYLCRHINNDWAWRIVVVAQIAIPALTWAGLPFLPESPYWLVRKGRIDKAIQSMERLRGCSVHAREEVARIQCALIEEQQQNREGSSWSDCFNKPANLRRTVIAVGTQIFQQSQGISFVANYQTVFLAQIGFRQVLLFAVINYAVGVLANIFGMLGSDRLGRRNSLLYSALFLASTMLTIGGLTSRGSAVISSAMQNASVAMLILWFFCFQTTWGPMAWIITSEVPPAAVREKMTSLSGICAYGTGLIIVFVNPFLQEHIHGNVSFIYGAFSILAAAFVFFFVPELNKRSLQEIDELFAMSISARHFSTYTCQPTVIDKREENVLTHHVE